MGELNAINEFMKKVSEDKTLEEKALKVKKECGTTGKTISEFAEALAKLAQAEGFEVSVESMQAYVVSSEDMEVNKDELDKLAGGCGHYFCTYCTHYC